MKKILNKLISIFVLGSFVLNSVCYGLAPVPASQNPVVKREILACLARTQIRYAASEDARRLLEVNNTQCLLLSSGNYLVSEEIAGDDIKLLRAIIHEDIEAIMQILSRDNKTTYTALKELILKYFPPGIEVTLPIELYVNDTIARAFELLILRYLGIMTDNEMMREGGEFIKKIAPIIMANRHNYFTGEFWDSSLRGETISSAIRKGMRFYQVPMIAEEAREIRSVHRRRLYKALERKYKAIAIDIDGTMKDPHDPIRADMIHNLVDYVKRGGILIIATGREQDSVDRTFFQRIKELGITLSDDDCRRIYICGERGGSIYNYFELRHRSGKSTVIMKLKSIPENVVDTLSQGLLKTYIDDGSLSREDITVRGDKLCVTVDKERLLIAFEILSVLRTHFADQDPKYWVTAPENIAIDNIPFTSKMLGVETIARCLGIDPLQIAKIGNELHNRGNDHSFNDEASFSVDRYDPASEYQVSLKEATGLEGITATTWLLNHLSFDYFAEQDIGEAMEERPDDAQGIFTLMGTPYYGSYLQNTNMKRALQNSKHYYDVVTVAVKKESASDMVEALKRAQGYLIPRDAEIVTMTPDRRNAAEILKLHQAGKTPSPLVIVYVLDDDISGTLSAITQVLQTFRMGGMDLKKTKGTLILSGGKGKMMYPLTAPGGLNNKGLLNSINGEPNVYQALRQIMQFFRSGENGFLITPIDKVISISQPLGIQKGADIELFGSTVSTDYPTLHDYGKIASDHGGRLQKLIQRESEEERLFISDKEEVAINNLGTMFVKPQAFSLLLNKCIGDKGLKDRALDMHRDLFEKQDEYPYISFGYNETGRAALFHHIGQIPDYYDAIQELFTNAALRLVTGVELDERGVLLGSGVSVGPEVVLEPGAAVLGNGVLYGKGRVEKGAVVIDPLIRNIEASSGSIIDSVEETGEDPVRAGRNEVVCDVRVTIDGNRKKLRIRTPRDYDSKRNWDEPIGETGYSPDDLLKHSDTRAGRAFKKRRENTCIQDAAAKTAGIQQRLHVNSAHLEKIDSAFGKYLKERLEGTGRYAKLLPVKLGNPSGKEKGLFLTLDVGGTNVRVSLVLLKGAESVVLNSDEYKLGPGDIKGSGEEFFKRLAGLIKTFMDNNGLSSKHAIPLGFTFPFPLDQKDIHHGRLVEWRKGYDLSQVIGKDVTGFLEQALVNTGIRNVPVVSVSNDIIALHMAAAYENDEYLLACSVGTGGNISFRAMLGEDGVIIPSADGDYIIDTEPGNFNLGAVLGQLTSYDERLIAYSGYDYLRLSTLTSGRYLGELTRLILAEQIANGNLFGGIIPEKLKDQGGLTTEDMAFIEGDTSFALTNIRAFFENAGAGRIDRDEAKAIQEICLMVSTRAARIMASVIGSTYKTVEPGAVKPLTIALGGAMFEKYPGFAQRVLDTLVEMYGEEKIQKGQVIAKASTKGAASIAACARLSYAVQHLCDRVEERMGLKIDEALRHELLRDFIAHPLSELIEDHWTSHESITDPKEKIRMLVFQEAGLLYYNALPLMSKEWRYMPARVGINEERMAKMNTARGQFDLWSKIIKVYSRVFWDSEMGQYIGEVHRFNEAPSITPEVSVDIVSLAARHDASRACPFPVTIVFSKKNMISINRNITSCFSRGAYRIFVDDDVQMVGPVIEELVQVLRDNPGIGLVSLPSYYHHRGIYKPRWHNLTYTVSGRLKLASAIFGMLIATRADIVDLVPFVNFWPNNGEDRQFCQQVHKLGFMSAYATPPEAYLIHEYKKPWKGLRDCLICESLMAYLEPENIDEMVETLSITWFKRYGDGETSLEEIRVFWRDFREMTKTYLDGDKDAFARLRAEDGYSHEWFRANRDKVLEVIAYVEENAYRITTFKDSEYRIKNLSGVNPFMSVLDYDIVPYRLEDVLNGRDIFEHEIMPGSAVSHDDKQHPAYTFARIPYGKISIGDFCKQTDIQRSAIEEHLKILETLWGLVTVHRDAEGKPAAIECPIPDDLKPPLLEILESCKDVKDIERLKPEILPFIKKMYLGLYKGEEPSLSLYRTHAENVSDIVLILARQLNYSEEEVRSIFKVSLIHDVGNNNENRTLRNEITAFARKHGIASTFVGLRKQLRDEGITVTPELEEKLDEMLEERLHKAGFTITPEVKRHLRFIIYHEKRSLEIIEDNGINLSRLEILLIRYHHYPALLNADSVERLFPGEFDRERKEELIRHAKKLLSVIIAADTIEAASNHARSLHIYDYHRKVESLEHVFDSIDAKYSRGDVNGDVYDLVNNLLITRNAELIDIIKKARHIDAHESFPSWDVATIRSRSYMAVLRSGEVTISPAGMLEDAEENSLTKREIDYLVDVLLTRRRGVLTENGLKVFREINDRAIETGYVHLPAQIRYAFCRFLYSGDTRLIDMAGCLTGTTRQDLKELFSREENMTFADISESVLYGFVAEKEDFYGYTDSLSFAGMPKILFIGPANYPAGRQDAVIRKRRLYPHSYRTASFLSQHGVDVDIYDVNFDGWKGLEELLGTGYYDFICVSPSNPVSNADIKMAEYIHENCEDAVLVLGGEGAAFDHTRFLKEHNIPAAIIRGFGSKVMLDMAVGFKDKHPGEYMGNHIYNLFRRIPNLYLQDFNGTVIPTRLVERFTEKYIRAVSRIVDYAKVPYERYWDSDLAVRPKVDFLMTEEEQLFYRDTIRIVTKSHCNYNCRFCSYCHFLTAAISGSYQPVLSLPAGDVRVMMRRILKAYPAFARDGLIFINDDDFIGPETEKMLDFFEKGYGKDEDIAYFGFTRVDKVNDRLLKRLRKAGFRKLLYGIETFSERLLDEMRKRYKSALSPVQLVRQVIKSTLKAGIVPVMTFMLFYPTATLSDVKVTIDETVELVALGAVPNVYPYAEARAGADLTEEARSGKMEIVGRHIMPVDPAMRDLAQKAQALQEEVESRVRKLHDWRHEFTPAIKTLIFFKAVYETAGISTKRIDEVIGLLINRYRDELIDNLFGWLKKPEGEKGYRYGVVGHEINRLVPDFRKRIDAYFSSHPDLENDETVKESLRRLLESDDTAGSEIIFIEGLNEDWDTLPTAHSLFDAESAAVLPLDILRDRFSAKRTYMIKYDDERLTESQKSIIKKYAEIMNQKGQAEVEAIPFSRRRGSKEALINVYCLGSRGEYIGEGHVDVDIPDGDVRDYLLRITGMLNIAFAKSNIPPGVSEEELSGKYGPLIGFIRDQYRDILGTDISLKAVLRKVIILVLPEAYKRSRYEIQKYNDLARKALESV